MGYGGGFDGGYNPGATGYGGTTVSQETPCGKMAGGICCMCFGLIAFPAVLFTLGWNEKRHVCEENRYYYLEKNAKELDCNSAPAGTIAYFSCKNDANTYSKFTPASFNPVKNDAFANSLEFIGPVGRQKVTMLQCDETEHSESYKCGSSTCTRHYYTYKLVWQESVWSTSLYQNSQIGTQRAGCAGWDMHQGTPVLPQNLGPSLRVSGHPMKSGAFTLDTKLMDDMTSDDYAAVTTKAVFRSAPLMNQQPWGTPVSPQNLYQSGSIFMTCTNRVGCVKIEYFTNRAPYSSVVSKIAAGGYTSTVPIPSSWGCSKEQYSEVVSSSVPATMEETLAAFRERTANTTWIIRACGIIGAWIAVACIFAPITALIDIMGDAIDCLFCGFGDSCEACFEGIGNCIVCTMSAGIGCGCAFCVISIVYVYMRPIIGIPMLLLAICCIGGAIGSRFLAPWNSKGSQELEDDAEDAEE